MLDKGGRTINLIVPSLISVQLIYVINQLMRVVHRNYVEENAHIEVVAQNVTAYCI